MAVERATPYGAANFMVQCDRFGGEAAAGFEEVSGMALEVDVHEYRNGSDASLHVRKLPGLARTGEVTLRRGVTGNLDLYNWMRDVANGDPNSRATVTIQLLDEARAEVAMAWRLVNAFPMRYSGPRLDARDQHGVALEELVLAYEDLIAE